MSVSVEVEVDTLTAAGVLVVDVELSFWGPGVFVAASLVESSLVLTDAVAIVTL